MGGARERLSVEEIDREDLLAASHVHRYELAAELLEGARVLDLCCGTGYGSRLLADRAGSVHGVDIAPDAVESARESLGADGRDGITFEQADALAYVRSLGTERFDAVVCFEGIEHVPEPDALLDELARLAAGGTRLIVSFPNSRGFDEENEFHVTDYGYEDVLAAADRLGDALLVEQRLAEASVLLPAGGEGELALGGRVRVGERADPAWANHWLVLVGFEPASIDVARARLSLTVAANPNGYMRLLEEANRDLRLHNARLARRWLGVHDAAAGVTLRRLEEIEQEARHWERDARKWEEIAGHNDWARQLTEKRFARRRYEIADTVADAVNGLPGIRQLRRLLSGRSG